MTRTSCTARSAVVGLALTAALTACGSAQPDSAGPSPTPSTTPTGSPAAADAPERRDAERITPRGIAVVVRDHLGPRAVRQFMTFDPEPGSVVLMIRLREGGRGENFAVTVSSPQQADQYGGAEVCPPEGGRRLPEDVHCRTLDNGTSVMTSETQEGFSDDNAHGMVVFGTAVNRRTGAAMAMYESYDDTPAVRAADLDGILADPRLTWHTDPSVNQGGDELRIRELDG